MSAEEKTIPDGIPFFNNSGGFAKGRLIAFKPSGRAISRPSCEYLLKMSQDSLILKVNLEAGYVKRA